MRPTRPKSTGPRIRAIPVGQWEAAASLGMSPLLSFRRIILPQAIRGILPPMTNDLVALFKNTSIVSIIALEDLTKQYQILSKSEPAIRRDRHGHRRALPGYVGAVGVFVALAGKALGERRVSHEISVVLEGVSKRFGQRLVLDNVSLAVEVGETVAVIGPSGGGKSTLLRCINGLTCFDQGRVPRGAAHARAGPRSPQRPADPPDPPHPGHDLSGFPTLRAPHRLAKRDGGTRPRARAAPRSGPAARLGLLARVGLADRADAYPRELSGGQKQRVAIARAMAMEPRGLLCDEITSALDPELKNEVLSVLEDLNRDGLTIIIVTHEMGFARRAADRIVVLADGRIIEEGPPEQVLDAPKMPRTQRFLSQVLS